MRKDVIASYLDLYAPVLFQPKGLIVLAHLSPEAIDEIAQLDIFPSPKTLVRSSLIVSHGLDPRLADQARLLIQQLSDPSPHVRDEAESSLFDMGPVAVPVLEDALRDKDIEVVFRAERLLLRMNRQVP
jgi:HEAT repeat protein